jgi:predicted RNA-binding Zn-ribbon protein involved in translation (DUF1610 family)
MVLYAGMAPGSTQISSSINAVSGVHPGLIDEHTAQTVTLADRERLRLERLEKCAARVALGMNDEAAIHGDVANDVGTLPPGEEIQQSTRPQSTMMDFEPQHLAADDELMSRHLAILSKPKQSKPHIPLNFNDPSLDPSRQFALRLQEARWRQRKRRRDRRRKRSGILTGISTNGNGFNILPGGNFSQQLRRAPAGPLPPQHFLANNGVRKPGDSPIINVAGGISSMGHAVPGVGVVSSDIAMKGDSSNSRPIEYICAICNEHYPFSCDMNPWWALSNHDCPKCGKTQIPRLDIAAPANAIEYHPALLAHLDEGNTKIETIVETSSYPPLENVTSDNTPVASTSTSMPMGIYGPPYQPNAIAANTQIGMPYNTRGPINPALAAGIARDTSGFSDSDVSHTDESDGEGGSGSVNGGFNYDESSDDEEEPPFSAGGDSNMDDDDDDDDSAAREESVEREDFGYEYKGEKLSDGQARRLLVLIEHASTCPGR